MSAPFRADQVGSLLRPDWLAAARVQCKRGEIDAAALAATEDRAIREAVQRQEAAGLHSITDGEFRRDWWHLDFLGQLDGVTLKDNAGPKFKFAGQAEQPPIATVTGKLGCSRPIMADDFAFLKSVTSGSLNSTPKMTIPSPSMLHLRGGRAAISTEVYPDMAAFWADVAAAYRVAIRHLADAGCRYLQLDDITFAYLCDPKIQANCRANGDDPLVLPRIYADTINAALVGKPADMKVTIHTCRGNFKSAWVAEGGYDPVVEAMFSTNVDGYFMEFDSARAGGFEPLKALPKGKKVVLGLVTTKLGQLESKDDLKRRIDEAARFVPLSDLCLSPQCGFSSTHHGNALSQDDQWRKLERVVEVANDVWGIHMNGISFTAFEADAKTQGFDEVLERQWKPHTVVGVHTHPFAAKALVVGGEMWLTVGDATRHLRAGDTFELDREVPHSERYGGEGATYWVARRG